MSTSDNTPTSQAAAGRQVLESATAMVKARNPGTEEVSATLDAMGSFLSQVLGQEVVVLVAVKRRTH